jgi:arabinan endo-1,5-alpha-L-arabinosidase
LKIGTKWQHVAVTLQANSFVIYIDGKNVKQGSITSPIKAYRTLCYFGRSFWGDPSFNGELDDMKIFNRSLSSDEIIKVMNSF